MRPWKKQERDRIWKNNVKADFEYICDEMGYSARRLRGDCRKDTYFNQRIAVARELRALEYSIPKIAWAMHRDAGTIAYYLCKYTRKRRKEMMRKYMEGKA
jgi:hypothetical protein